MVVIIPDWWQLLAGYLGRRTVVDYRPRQQATPCPQGVSRAWPSQGLRFDPAPGTGEPVM